MPTVDRGWLDQQQRFPPLGPQPAQQQPKETVSRAKAAKRTRQDAELVAQGKRLEQQVYAPCLAGRAVAAVLEPLRIACRVPSGDTNVNGFCWTGYWRATTAGTGRCW